MELGLGARDVTHAGHVGGYAGPALTTGRPALDRPSPRRDGLLRQGGQAAHALLRPIYGSALLSRRPALLATLVPSRRLAPLRLTCGLPQGDRGSQGHVRLLTAATEREGGREWPTGELPLSASDWGLIATDGV